MPGGRGAAGGGLRRSRRPDRRRAPPALRPAPAVEAGAGRDVVDRPHRAAGRRRRPRPRVAARDPGHRARPRRRGRWPWTTARTSPSTGWSSPPARRRARCPCPTGWPGSTPCARSTTASPSAPSSTPPRPGGGGRRRLHRRRGGGDLPGAGRCEVTMVEALPAPLARVLGEVIGGTCADLHRDHGVDVRTGVGVAGLDGGSRVEQVPLDDGSAVDADVVVVGVGVTPAHRLARGLGAHPRRRRGLRRDLPGRARAWWRPATSPAGPTRRFGEMMRVEHWDNALDQGAHAARTLLAGDGGGAAVRAGALVLVRPVRPQAPARRPARARRRGAGRARARSRSAASSRCSAGPAGWSRRSA